MKYNRKLLVAILLIASIAALGYFMISPAAVDTSSCVCTMVYAPVCGVDGQTYSNSCVAGCAGVEVDYTGECDISPENDDKLTIYGYLSSVWQWVLNFFG